MLAGITEETNAKAVEFIKAMAGPMSLSNRDGLGYTAVNELGDMFGQRWFLNDSAFKPAPIIPDTSDIDSKIAAYGESVEYSKAVVDTKYGEYNSFGDVDLSKMVAITMHTRMATSSKGFNNTHPFVYADDDTSLIHNGVIRNVEDFKFKVSTCDSEAILISYLKAGVVDDPTNIQDMADLLTGYYACGVFGRDLLGNRTMDVFKANGARLAGVWINELNTFAYSTSEYDIKEACSKVGLTVGPSFIMKDEWLTRLDYLTGGVIVTIPFRQGSEYAKYTPPPVYAGFSNHHKSVKFVNKKKALSNNMTEYLLLKPSTRILNQLEIREITESFAKEA